MSGGTIRSVGIGGREYAVADDASAWISLGGGPALPSGGFTLEFEFACAPPARRNASHRRAVWWLRNLARRERRKRPCAAKIARTLKARLRAAARPWNGVVLTDGNREQIKAAMVKAASDALALLGVHGFTPSVEVPMVRAPNVDEAEISFGYAFPEHQPEAPP